VTDWRRLKLGNSVVLAALYIDAKQPSMVAIGRNRSMWSYIFIGDTNDVKTATSFDYYKISALKLSALFTQIRRDAHYSSLSPENEDRLQWIKAVANLSQVSLVKDAFFNMQKDALLKSCISHVKLDRAKTLKIVSTDLKIALHHVEEYFGSAPESSEGDIRIGNSVLYFPEGARASNVEILKTLVETIYKDLESKGLSKLFNGPIRFVKSLGNLLGYYDLTSKDIKIAYSAKNDKRTEYTVMHEYGHKYFYEFIPDKKEFITNKYKELMKANGGHDDSSQAKEIKDREENFLKSLKAGDIFVSTRRKYKGEWVVEVVEPRLKRIALTKVGEPENKISGPVSVFLNPDWQAKNPDLAVIQYRAPKKHELGETSAWFPTKYSEKNQSEWFAELFSFYMRGNLSGEPAEFMKELVH
jgi:hypothetical protein